MVYTAHMDFQNYANKFNVDETEFKHIICEVFNKNIGALAFFEGYFSEYFLEKKLLQLPEITECSKPGDNNLEIKGDLVPLYKGVPIRIEVKNIKRKTNDPKRKPKHVTNLYESYHTGFFSTRSGRTRKVTFSDGSVVHTYNVKRGLYDIIAVNVYQLTGKHEFAYCLESNLASTSHTCRTALTSLQCTETLRGDVCVKWPTEAPWTDNLESILEQAYTQKIVKV